MLQIDLPRLRRDRTLALNGAVAPESEIWKGSELEFAGAVQVSASAILTAEGGVVVRGSWSAPVRYECGRCLDPLDVAVERPFAVLYLAGDMAGDEWGGTDPDVRTVGRLDRVLDLREAIREEVLLEVPRYHLPKDQDGRCTACGDPVERCTHVAEDPREGAADPRWSALTALQTD